MEKFLRLDAYDNPDHSYRDLFQISPDFAALFVLPGLAILCINLVWVGLIIAVLSTRFRDISQIVTSVMQIAIFATPVMWQVSSLRDKTLIADINPLYHWLQLVRGPLLGEIPSTLSWTVSIASAVEAPYGAVVIAPRLAPDCLLALSIKHRRESQF